MADTGEWSSSASEVLHIRLKHSKKNKSQDVSFHPAWTYPVYGEDEAIFGYQQLRIQLDFTTDTFKPTLHVTSKAQFEPQGDIKPDDIEEPLKELIPGLANEDEASEIRENALFEPPGVLQHEYTVEGRKYGIWSVLLSDPGAKALLRNMQVLVLFFIEGGSIIDLDDPDWTIDRWRVFFTYAIEPASNGKPTYSFVGYSTAYTLWHLPSSPTSSPDTIETPPTPPSSLPPDDSKLQHQILSRSRISQFLVLPPYQRGGHGSRLYETMYTYFLHNAQTIEIPVEDPNEAFDELRDTCDLLRMRRDPAFTSLKLNTTNGILPRVKSEKLPTASLLDPSATEALRARTKIIPRQFDRLLEMQLLSQIPLRNRNINRLTKKDKANDEWDRAYYLWRMLVKQRLYKHNKDSLIQISVSERHEKLEEVVEGVEREYLRCLERVERRERHLREEEEALQAVNGREERVNGSQGKRGLKRRVVDEEDDDDEDEDEVATKKAKIGA